MHLEYNNPMEEHLGFQLKAIRQELGISLEEIAQKTHIRLDYLKAIENGDTNQLPTGPQYMGFLRLYASELGVEIEGLNIKGYTGKADTLTENGYLEPTANQATADMMHSASAHLPISSEEEREDQDDFKTQIPAVSDASKPGSHQPLPESSDSHQIFSELGLILRQRRELLSLSIEEIYQHLHIQKKFLEGMEAGEFSEFPSPVQTKGMLANYAEFLNLDADNLLLKYADGLQTQRLERLNKNRARSPKDAKILSPTGLRLKNFFSLDLLVIAALFLGFAAFIIWGVNRILRVDPSGTSPTGLPEVADVLLATGSPTPAVTLTNGMETSGPENQETQLAGEAAPLFTPLPNDNPINLVIIPRQRAWVRVLSDSETVYEGRMLPGNAYDFSGQEVVEILTGSAGALQIYFNEQDIGAPGLVGQVITLIFTENGLLLPTPTNTATITQTPEITPTPTVSPTLDSSITPTEIND